MKTTNRYGWLLMNYIVSLQLELTTNITGDYWFFIRIV